MNIRFKRRLVAFFCVGSLALFAIFGCKNLAVLTRDAGRYLTCDSTTGYRPNPGLKLALAIDPEIAEAYDSRGCEKFLAGEPSAGADLSKAIQLRPDDAFFYMHLAKADELSCQFAKAASELQRCLELAPNINTSDLRLQIEAYALRSDIHLRLGNLKHALADVNTALKKTSLKGMIFRAPVLIISLMFSFLQNRWE